MFSGQNIKKHYEGVHMYNVCLLFSGRRGLDLTEIRNSILRIPEVSRKINHAQNILDRTNTSANHVDLIAYMLSSDQEFESQPKLKSLVTAIVQVGLFDRFVRHRNRPQYLIGKLNDCSALKVCADLQSLSDMIYESDYFLETRNLRPIPNGQFLSGAPLEEYAVYVWGEGQYNSVETKTKEAALLVAELYNDNKIQQCIHIGPHHQFRMAEFEKWGLDGIPSMSSIDLDPILNFFWRTA